MKMANCIMGGCAELMKNCKRCGHDREEHKRREQLPLEKGPDGLLRKCVGLPEEEEDFDHE